MDLTINWTHIIAVVTFILGGWVAIRNATQKQISELSIHLAQMGTRLELLEHSQMDVHALGNQITALSVKLDELKSDVSKHNQLIERTYQLETETKAQWKRIDEMRNELHEVKVGGST